jgi:hypothetical protein
MISIDKGFESRVLYSDICLNCRHYNWDRSTGDSRVCDAFANIPQEIWDGKNPHTSSYSGDNGILFEPREVPLKQSPSV